MSYAIGVTGGNADSIQLVVAGSGTPTLDVHVTQIDKDNASPPVVTTVRTRTAFSGAATTKITTDPATNHEATVTVISVANTGAAACTFLPQLKLGSGTATSLFGAAVTLQVGETALYNGTTWFCYDATLGVKTALAAPLSVTVLTSGTAATYTTKPGCRALFVECWGAGAGGAGGANAASNASVGSGGGSGSYCSKLYSPPAATYTYTVGAKGAGGTSGANGAVGNSTTWGALTAPGGLGGVFQATQVSLLDTVGGVGGAIATGGDVNGAGAPGGNSKRSNGTIAVSGFGGSTSLGGGGGARSAQNAGLDAIANTGSGGGGAATINGGGVTNGGNGADGLIRVTEFF